MREITGGPDACPHCGTSLFGDPYCPNCGAAVGVPSVVPKGTVLYISRHWRYVIVMGRPIPRSELLAIVGGWLLIVGSLLPWKIMAIGSFGGVDFAPGLVSFVVGVIAILPMFADDELPLWPVLGIGVAGLIGFALVLNLQLTDPISGFGLPLTYLGLGATIVAPVVKYYDQTVPLERRGE